MCGRAYATYTDEELAIRYLNQRTARIPKLKPTYNLAPTQDALILRMQGRVQGAEPIFRFDRWGLVPPREPEFKTKLSTINATAEKIAQSRLYRASFIKRRCIVPLSGFIEWVTVGGRKHPVRIFSKTQPILSLAGIWETWHGPNGPGEEAKESFSIVTTTANAFMEKMHHRMPVILEPEDEAAWLDPANTNEEKLVRLLRPYRGEDLEAFEISPAVNSPKNNRPEVLEPVLPPPEDPQLGWF